MRLMPPGLNRDDLLRWVSMPEHDVRTWVLKAGAPRSVVAAFPEFVDRALRPDYQPAATLRFDEHMPQSVDMTNPSTMFVRTWQLAKDARRIHNEAIAVGLDRPLADRLEAHAVELEFLRDKIHDALLTDEDRANGATPRAKA